MESSPIDWLKDRTGDDGLTGFDAEGWDASIWILHRMYEHLGVDDDRTHDQLHRHEIETGVREPQIVGTINLAEVGEVTGIPLGGRNEPAPDWQRLSWHELARRLGITFDDVAYPPCFRWFLYTSWPIRLAPPCEGSLERPDLQDLIDVLIERSVAGPRTLCECYFSPLSTGNFDEVDVRRVPLGEVLDLYDQRSQSPTNFWATDRSWLVFTDSDLEGTKVSGGPSLIAALREDQRLETIDQCW